MDLELHRRREQLVERTRREAQLAALQYEEEKIRTKQIQRDAVLDFVKLIIPLRILFLLLSRKTSPSALKASFSEELSGQKQIKPKLTMAKCRRNVENFLEACRKIGVPQEQLCLPLHILEEKGLSQVAVTVQALLELAPPKQQQQQQHQLSAV
ncbi:hypothetical protein K5549_003727 [Capra hircus]|nr:hypothetical protein K5549_003727 [Capra hircus]